MLKTIRSTRSAVNPKEIKREVGGNSVDGNSMVSSDEAINQANSIKKKNQAKITKSKILLKSKYHDFPPNSKNKEARTGFFTPKARLAFTQLKQAFVEALIFNYFDSKS